MNENLKLYLGAAALLGCFSGQSQVAQKPNVLFLFADDQRADALGCAGNTYIRTPNIDQLAHNGVRFTHSYVMGGHHGAICAPSRAMLMSGKSLFHVYDRLEGVQTMPAYFAKHGYETFGTGKWHNGKSTFEATFQKAKNVMLGGMSDHFKVPCNDMGADGKLHETVSKGFSTDIFAGAAKEFLDDYSKGKKDHPFFCYVAFTAPHDPVPLAQIISGCTRMRLSRYRETSRNFIRSPSMTSLSGTRTLLPGHGRLRLFRRIWPIIMHSSLTWMQKSGQLFSR